MHLVFLVILLHFVNAMRYTASNLRLDENDFLNFHKFLLLNFSHREIFHVILAAGLEVGWAQGVWRTEVCQRDAGAEPW